MNSSSILPHLSPEARFYVDEGVPEDPSPVVLGPRLEAGSTYMIEMAVMIDVSPTTIDAALVAIGLGAMLYDASLADPGALDADQWMRSDDLEGPPARLLRFLATARSTIHLTDGPIVVWLAAVKVHLDVRSDLSEEARLEPHDLVPGVTYEVRFLSRMRSESAGKRAAVLRSLRESMHFDVGRLMSLKRDMRMPGRPNASDELWFATVMWPAERGVSVLTIDDPFFFYDVRAVGALLHPLESGSLDEEEQAALDVAIAHEATGLGEMFSNADVIPPEA